MKTSTFGVQLKMSMVFLITAGFLTATVKTMNFSRGSVFKSNDIYEYQCEQSFNSAVETCYDEIMAPYDKKSPKNQMNQNGNEWTYCCAATATRNCIFEKVRKPCGDKFADSVKITQSEYSCGDGKQDYYQQASPLCWNIWGQIAGIAIIIMLITSCCCCIHYRRKKLLRNKNEQQSSSNSL